MADSKTVTRAYSFKLRAENDEVHGYHIIGRPIVYNSRTSIGNMFEEVIESGALEGCDLKDVRFLINHNTDMIPLARSRNNNENSTMQMRVDTEGMEIRVNLDIENNTEAGNLYSAIKRGDITGMSFMFEIEDESWEDLSSDFPLHKIIKIRRVLEVSAVTFPAYEATEISARAKQTLDSVKNTLDNVRTELSNNGSSDIELERLKAKYIYNI